MGNCVEVAPFVGRVGIRDSKDPAGHVLNVPATSWRNFLVDAKVGRFDRH